MSKINGYSREEAESFVKFICRGKGQGKTLTRLFGEYAAKTGRAKGSVRNYYYALLRSTDNAEVKDILRGTSLRAENVRPFTDEETDKILREILRQKSKGISVRRAVLSLAGGDDKLMLRYQNKYRNVASKQPERLERLSRECAGEDEGKRAIERSIDGLCDRLGEGLRQENQRLKALIKKLTDENNILRLQVKNLQS